MAGVSSLPPSPHEKVENVTLHNNKPSFVSVLLSNDSNVNQTFKRTSNKIEPKQPSSTFIGSQQIFLGNEVSGNTLGVDNKNTMDYSFLKPVSVFQGKPSISFQLSEKLALIEKMKYVLIAKSSHGRPPMASIKSYFSSLHLKGDPLISVLDSKHLVIECKLFEDFSKLWTKRSWVIGGFSFRIFKWSEDFNPQKESPLSPVWIHLPRLPLYLYDEAALMSIGNAIGKPLRLDRRNTSHDKLAYASICVELDVSIPKIDDIWISFAENGSIVDGFWQHIVYDAIPPYCVNCKHLGHTIDVCKRKIHVLVHESSSAKENALEGNGIVLGGLQQCLEHKECEQGEQGVSNSVELENIVEEGEIVESTKEIGTVSVREGCGKGSKQLEGMLLMGLVEHAKGVFTKELGEDKTAEVGLAVQKGEEDDAGSVQSDAGETGIGQETTGNDAGSQEFADGKVAAAQKLPAAATVWEGADGHSFVGQAVAEGHSNQIAGANTHSKQAAVADTPGEPVSACLLLGDLHSAAGLKVFEQADGDQGLQVKPIEQNIHNSPAENDGSVCKHLDISVVSAVAHFHTECGEHTADCSTVVPAAGEHTVEDPPTAPVHDVRKSAADRKHAVEETAATREKFIGAVVAVSEIEDEEGVVNGYVVSNSGHQTASYSKGEESVQQVYDRIKKMKNKPATPRKLSSAAAEYIPGVQDHGKIDAPIGQQIKKMNRGKIGSIKGNLIWPTNTSKVSKTDGFIDLEKMKSILRRPSRRDRDDPLLKRTSTCDTNDLGDFILPFEVDSEPSSPTSRNSQFMDE